jgi:hypothetical protein
LSHTTYTTIRFPAVFALLNARLAVVPLVTWVFRACTKAADAAYVPEGDTMLRVAAARTREMPSTT